MAQAKSKLQSIKEKYAWSPASTDAEGRAVRTIKMLEPDCKEHRIRKGWTKECIAAGHDPFVMTFEEEVNVPKYEEDAEGDKVLTGTKVVLHSTITPLVSQFSYAKNINDKKSIQLAKQRGCLSLESQGFKPFCEMMNCWREANIRTNDGDFCSKRHLAVILLAESNVATEILDAKKKEAQLRSVLAGAF